MGWDRYPKTFLSQRHLQEMKIINVAISAGGDILPCPMGITLACYSKGAQWWWGVWRGRSCPFGRIGEVDNQD